jgi:hypothetical protein
MSNLFAPDPLDFLISLILAIIAAISIYFATPYFTHAHHPEFSPDRYDIV